MAPLCVVPPVCEAAILPLGPEFKHLLLSKGCDQEVVDKLDRVQSHIFWTRQTSVFVLWRHSRSTM